MSGITGGSNAGRLDFSNQDPFNFEGEPSGARKAQKHKHMDKVLGDYQSQIDGLDRRLSQLETDEGVLIVDPVSIDYHTNPVNISNTAVATLVFTAAISPAYKMLRIEIPFKLVNNTGGTRTLGLTINVNGNLLFTQVTSALGSGGNPRTGMCYIYISRITDNSQWVHAGIEVSGSGAAGTWSNPVGGDGKRGYDLGAINMSATSTVDVYFTLAAAAATTWNLDTFGAHGELKL
jgi:hypothetical protein